MDITSLRVFDILHDLEITEQEFTDLETEQNHTDRKGLFIRCIKKGYSICVSHDEKHSILIRKIEGITTTPSRILLKTLVTCEVPDEIFTLHALCHYRALDTDIRREAHNIKDLKTIIIDRFIDDYEKTELGGYYETVHYNELHNYDDTKRLTYEDLKCKLVDVQLRAIFWLFDEDYETFSNEVKVARNNISRIIKVFEKKNRRLAIIQREDNYEKRRGGGMMNYRPIWYENVKGSAIMVRCFKPSQPQYDYVDVNRELFIPNGNGGKIEIWLDDDLFEKTGYHELKVLSNRLVSDYRWLLLNADEFNNKQTVIRMEVMSATRKDKEAQAKEQLEERIDTSFKSGKVIVRHGITFKQNSIEYEGMTVKNNKLGDFIMLNNLHLLNEPNFSKIVKDFIIYILNFKSTYNYSGNTSFTCCFEGEDTITIGKVKLHLERRKNNILVNNHRISKDDLLEIIYKALTFTNQAKFDEYLKYSASVNLTLQKALMEGWVSFNLIIDETNDNDLSRPEKPNMQTCYDSYPPFEMRTKSKISMDLALPIKRVKNKNFTVINGVEYQIQNIQALFDLGKDIDSVRIGYSGGGYLQRIIKLLNKAIKGISPKTIGDIVKNGTDEYNKLTERIRIENALKCKRADEFVETAIRVSRAKKIKQGFIVKGISGKVYTVNAQSLAIYEQGNDERYICFQDFETDTDTEWGRKDGLAKRLLFLAHDLKVADEVHTLELKNHVQVTDNINISNLVEVTA
jgi:hypothetical protein